MAHEHSHGEGEGNFFLDQLFTILTCGAIGLVAILMYQTNFLSRILVPMFYLPVAIGGGAIIVLAAIRAVAVWKLAGERSLAVASAENAAEDHGHAHGAEECGHEHGHAHSHGGHDHGHSHAASGHDHAHSHAHAEDAKEVEVHDHGWAPWRYMVLAVPVFLYFLGLPRDGLNAKFVDRNMSGQLHGKSTRTLLGLLAGGTAVRKTEPTRINLQFKELTLVAATPSRHDAFEDNIGVLRGQYLRSQSSDREFTLFRVNRTCCVADEVYLEIRIVAPEPITTVEPLQWVRVEGVISFQMNDRGKWIPVITLKSNTDIDTNVEPTTNVNDP